MKKRSYCRIFMVLSVILLTACSVNTQKRMLHQLELGQKYLLEERYEETIIAFNKVIAMDPKQIQAYTGLVEAYAKSGDFTEAQDTIHAGYQIIRDLDAEEYRDLILSFIDQAMIVLFENTYENTEEEWVLEMAQLYSSLTGKKGYEIIALFGESLNQLQQIPEAEMGKEDIRELFGDDFWDFAAHLEETVYYELEDGRWLGIYPEGYVYLGEMEDEIRSGMGIWFGKEILYTGSWAENYPEGAGKYDWHGVFEGNWHRGYADGEINFSWYDGEEYWGKYRCIFKNGVPVSEEKQYILDGSRILTDIVHGVGECVAGGVYLERDYMTFDSGIDDDNFSVYDGVQFAGIKGVVEVKDYGVSHASLDALWLN